MARGKSGRIVIEIDPKLKRELYLKLEEKQRTLKEWFVAEANEIVYGKQTKNTSSSDKEKKTKSI